MVTPYSNSIRLEDGGNVIDDNGAWLIDLPMNMNFVTTNEFGERVTSVDPTSWCTNRKLNIDLR